MSRLGIVTIGRNEGERLVRCLKSLQGSGCPVVYVDSASTDGSQERAAALGATVHPLDMTRPFTAARARAEGYERLKSYSPELDLVMFVDGDCEIEPGWIDTAMAFLDGHPQHAVVCGRRRERFPEASVYNRLMDAEWDTPIGDADAAGGDSVVRTDVYENVGGFDPTMLAHEEPEFCARVRQAGFRIARIDHPMTVHDADIHSAKAYLKRSMRGGYGYIQAMRRIPSEVSSVERGLVRRALQWPALFLIAVIASFLWWPAMAVFAVLVVASLIRDSRNAPAGVAGMRFAWLRFTGKLAEFVGIVRWGADRARGKASSAPTYK